MHWQGILEICVDLISGPHQSSILLGSLLCPIIVLCGLPAFPCCAVGLHCTGGIESLPHCTAWGSIQCRGLCSTQDQCAQRCVQVYSSEG